MKIAVFVAVLALLVAVAAAEWCAPCANGNTGGCNPNGTCKANGWCDCQYQCRNYPSVAAGAACPPGADNLGNGNCCKKAWGARCQYTLPATWTGTPPPPPPPPAVCTNNPGACNPNGKCKADNTCECYAVCQNIPAVAAGTESCPGTSQNLGNGNCCGQQTGANCQISPFDS
eukprot:EC797030.1.p3 GENE.EC797030.1~~EC797030.1.p3  ORF type:complete len:173 (+),score=51.80 EC797030.1:3-521(+)